MPTKPPSEIKGGPGCTFPAKPVAFAAYVLLGLLTFGHVFNANYVEPTPVVDCGAVPEALGKGWEAYWDCRKENIWAPGYGTSRFEAGFPAILAGVAWPVYWAGSMALKVTK